MASIFTKIIQGELPCYKIYEDEHTFAFLALDQIQLGHTLVVPKKEVDHFFDTPDPDYQQVFANGRKIAKAIKAVTGCKRVLASVVGFEVPHFHLHLIPAWDMSDLSFSKATRRSPTEMQDMADKIRGKLT